jgi:hypothetical protein
VRRHRHTSRKPAKARQATKAKRGAASKPVRNRRVSALSKDTEVARLARELAEALEQQTATSEVLGVISSSPGELEPVFQTMLANATRICHAKFGIMFRFDGEKYHFAAEVGLPAEFAGLVAPAHDDFFLEGGAMKFIEKSAIITGEYWVRVY